MFLYALTILVSAFLLFQVQPMIAKIILPWFGGSAPRCGPPACCSSRSSCCSGTFIRHCLIRYLETARPNPDALRGAVAQPAALPIFPNGPGSPPGATNPRCASWGCSPPPWDSPISCSPRRVR